MSRRHPQRPKSWSEFVGVVLLALAIGVVAFILVALLVASEGNLESSVDLGGRWGRESLDSAVLSLGVVIGLLVLTQSFLVRSLAKKWNPSDGEAVGTRSPGKIEANYAVDRRTFIEALARDARLWAGEAGLVTISRDIDDVIFELLPSTNTAAPVWVVATDWIDIQVGRSNNSRWKLSYSTDNASLVGDLVKGVIDGDVTEFRAFGRTQMRIGTSRGRIWSKPGQERLWGWIPAPGWRQWGDRRDFGPYQ